MKVVVFNLRYGANLGDRLVAHCLAAELESADPSFEVVTEDLAGRDALQNGAGSRGMRMAALYILQAMPRPIRQMIAGHMLSRLVRRKLEPRWRMALADADAIVIGGGGLFADSDLNFPMKISAALRMANERGIPVAVHASGVSPGWTARGRELFGEAFSDARLCSVTLRDDRAVEFWNSELGAYALHPASVAPDPALTLARHIDPGEAPPAGPATIGLCITSPAALRYHSARSAPPPDMMQWYPALAAELTRRGYRVVGFTTGALEDTVFATQLAPAFAEATNNAGYIVPASTGPVELVTLIRGFHGVVSHRLHAIITAHALGIPGLALAWDRKMAGQMEMLGYAERLLDAAGLSAAQAADRLEDIIEEGVDITRRDALAHEARQGTLRLARALREAVPAHEAPPAREAVPMHGQ